MKKTISRNRIIFISICLILMILFFFVFQNRPKYSYIILGRGGREKTEEITDGMVVMQEIPFHAGDKGVSFQISTNGHKVIGSLSVKGRGKTSDSIFFDKILPGKEIKNDQFVDFFYNKDIPNNDETVEVIFTSDCQPGMGAAILTTGNDALENYSMSINGITTSTDSMIKRIVPSDQKFGYWFKYCLIFVITIATAYIFLLGSDEIKERYILWKIFRKVQLFYNNLSEIQKICWIFFLAFLLATCWIYYVYKGNYPAETAVARYIITFSVFFLIQYCLKKYKNIPASKLIKQFAELLFVAAAGIIISYVLQRIGLFSRFSKRHIIFVLGLLMIIYMLIKYFNKSISENLLLSSIVFFMGSIYAFSYPATTGISWDDQNHYLNTVDFSHFPGEFLSQADMDLINKAYNGGGGKLLHEENPAQFENDVNDTYQSGKMSGYQIQQHGSRFSYPYLFQAAALFLGRSINLSYTYVFIFGRWIGVFVYTILFYFSLKQLKSGKLFLFFFSMLPISLFQMSNYTYDPWGIQFPMLAFAYYIGLMQDETKKITLKDTLFMCSLFFLGYIAKPVYGIMSLSLLLTPKNKFSKNFSGKKYYSIIIFTCLIINLTYLLPFVQFGPGRGDLRGGSEVNSESQVSFILNNPLQYALIMLNYLKSYWSLEEIGFLGYLGHNYNSLITVLFIVVALLDKEKNDNKITNTPRRIWTFLLAFIASAIISTAMYVSFTPVRASYIQGAQWRYLLPLFPFVGYYLGDYRIIAKIVKYISYKFLVLISSITTVCYASHLIYIFCLRYY